jgi:hypothetical protein
MIDKPPTSVNVPESEVARQATDALGGYVYQLDQTVMTWLTLDEDEALHVEFAEDVAVSGDGRLDLTQVKRVQANITLRSAGVAKLIVAVWEFQKNPSRRVTGALLTTSGIGKEKGKLSFPGRVPGLVYWPSRRATAPTSSPCARPCYAWICPRTCAASSAMRQPMCCGRVLSAPCNGWIAVQARMICAGT